MVFVDPPSPPFAAHFDPCHHVLTTNGNVKSAVMVVQTRTVQSYSTLSDPFLSVSLYFLAMSSWSFSLLGRHTTDLFLVRIHDHLINQLKYRLAPNLLTTQAWIKQARIDRVCLNTKRSHCNGFIIRFGFRYDLSYIFW